MNYNSTFYFDAAIDSHGAVVAGDVNGYYNYKKRDRQTLPIEVYFDHPGIMPVETMELLVPAWAARVRCFRLSIDINEKPKLLSSLLLHLNSFLRADGCKVTEIELNIRDCNVNNDVESSFYSRALYPIAKLPRDINLKLNLEGFDNEDLKEGLILFRQENDPNMVDSLRFDLFKEVRDLEPKVWETLLLSRQEDPNIADNLPFDHCEGFLDRESRAQAKVASLSRANPRTDCLRATGQQLWAILTKEASLDQDPCRFEMYSWYIERVFRKYVGLIKMIIEKLEQNPDADEQHAFLIECKALEDMRFNPDGLIWHLYRRDPLSALGLSDYPWITASRREFEAAATQ